MATNQQILDEIKEFKVHVYRELERIDERLDVTNDILIEMVREMKHDVLIEMVREMNHPGLLTRAHTFLKNLAYLAKNTTPTGIRLDLLDYEDEQ